MSETATRSVGPTSHHRVRDPWFSALIGLTTLAIVLQGLWAGIFLSYDRWPENWIEIHGRGGEVALGLAALATIVAVVRLRARRELWLGSLLLTGLLLLEAFLGGMISDGQRALTAVHVPLAMLILAVAVWLPLRSTGRSTGRG